MSGDPTINPEQHDTEQYARRVSNEVVRVPSAARSDADVTEEVSSSERHDLIEQAPDTAKRSRNPLRRIFSGTILLSDEARRNYPYLLTIAVMFFLNIVVLFWSLHLDMRHLQLEREVQKLRERSIRLEEQRFQLTSHSRIVEELARRGIDIQDPVRPAEIIE